jgi:hypothetical protein
VCLRRKVKREKSREKQQKAAKQQPKKKERNVSDDESVFPSLIKAEGRRVTFNRRINIIKSHI